MVSPLLPVVSPLLPVAARLVLAFDFGKGTWLHSTSGDRYLGFASGIAVNSLGHNHQHFVRALKTQAEKLWRTSIPVRISEGERLARLIAKSFADVNENNIY